MNLEVTSTQSVIPISSMKIGQAPEKLITFALGSCLGLTAYDPQLKIGGMIHCLLPISSLNSELAKSNPCTFVDIGVPLLLSELLNAGANKERLILKVAGCGHMMDSQYQFNVGQRNYTVLRKILWKNNLLITGEHVGGTDAKTMVLDLSNGSVLVKTSKGEIIL